ncbi:TraR/DksA C4-type zinc finger protein [Oceanobacter sp. 3_MG-2023]|uniref:TraR/DksA C4-type zinc finger protein n=1 Tax=Oceanobacter sp. 3_MG-2023 TaxID=3062622 RepID=UPI00273746E1|nr:TraR/DksA C4-type zinc finger protein [Oceanobacter sp. 3_MG-2023]
MADDADRAQVLIEQQEAFRNSLRAQAASASMQSAVSCIECDEPIPEARRAHIVGVQLCVECQAVNEAQARRYRF